LCSYLGEFDIERVAWYDCLDLVMVDVGCSYSFCLFVVDGAVRMVVLIRLGGGVRASRSRPLTLLVNIRIDTPVGVYWYAFIVHNENLYSHNLTFSKRRERGEAGAFSVMIMVRTLDDKGLTPLESLTVISEKVAVVAG
jgi:hypothetical protein